MSAFNDGRCEKCNRRMGWTGKVTEKPACPSCGHSPTVAELASLQNDEIQMAKMERLLLERSKVKCILCGASAPNKHKVDNVSPLCDYCFKVLTNG